ncbi:hypothetical protein ACJX0J_005453, partial [Zea mays]
AALISHVSSVAVIDEEVQPHILASISTFVCLSINLFVKKIVIEILFDLLGTILGSTHEDVGRWLNRW